MTAKNEKTLEQARNDYSVGKNEHDGIISRVKDSKEDIAKWVVEELLMEQEVEENERKIKELKDKIEKQKMLVSNTKGRIEGVEKN